MTTFADALTHYRQRATLSRAALVAASGVSLTMLGYLESGTRHPRRETVEALAGALGLSPLEADKLRLSAGFSPCDLVGLVFDACSRLSVPSEVAVGTPARKAAVFLRATAGHLRDEGHDLNAICRRVGEP